MPVKKAAGEPAKTPRKKPPVRRRPDPNKAARADGPGRDTKLTLVRLNAIVNLIAGGNFIKTACAFSGIGENTFHKWRMRGELEMDRIDSTGKDADQILEQFDGKDETGTDRASAEYMWRNRPVPYLALEWPYVVFAFQVKRAQAAAEIRALHNIQTAGKTQWQASAWWLERTRPEDYGRKDQVSVGGTKDGRPIKTEGKQETTIVTVDALTTALEAAMGGRANDQ